jgi:hypothetical protein
MTVMIMLRAAFVLMAASLGCVAHAEFVLSAGSARTTAGNSLELTLTVTNDAESELQIQLPESLHVRVETPTAVSTLEFSPDRSGDITIAAQQFARVRLRGTLPQDVQGLVTVTLTGFETNPVALQIENVPVPAAEVVPVDASADARRAWQNESRLVDKPPPLAV